MNKVAKEHGLHYFVETGTFEGETINTLKKHFNALYSVELSYDLYARAKQRFSNCLNVYLYQGDSGKVLPHIIGKLKGPVLFWLYPHYYGGLNSQSESDYKTTVLFSCQ